MLIDLEFAELHAPLFFLGRNLGLKLNPGNDHKHRDIALVFDTELQWLEVHDLAKNRVTYVPMPNVGNMTPSVAEKKAEEPKPAALGKVTAQVETPQDHVFGGPGKGKR